MPGAPLLLQANRRHTDRHLLDGNAGSTSPNDLENCCRVSPSSGRGPMGPFLCSPCPAHPRLIPPALEALSEPGTPPPPSSPSRRLHPAPFAVTAASPDLLAGSLCYVWTSGSGRSLSPATPAALDRGEHHPPGGTGTWGHPAPGSEGSGWTCRVMLALFGG